MKARKNLNIYQEIAAATIANEGFSYPVTVEIGNYLFPTKEYGNISLPAGYYDALRIKIGNADGENWWCSLFPPLCFVDISSGVISSEGKNYLKENLSEEEFSIVIGDSNNIKLKFKIRLQRYNYFKVITTRLLKY